jgi:hypothetical protein
MASIDTRPDGRWYRARWPEYPGGPQKVRHFARKRDADQFLDAVRGDLERIFSDLRALIDGTGKLDANRAHAVDIAVTIARALEREGGGA